MRPGVGKGPWPGEGAARPSACAGSREGAVRGRGAGGPVSGFPGGSALAGAPGRSWTCCRRWSAFWGGEMGDASETSVFWLFFRSSRRHTHHLENPFSWYR